MIPILYNSDNSYGTSRTPLGLINHTSRCVVKETLNGEYTLELSTDINDFTNGYISTQKIIEAKPNPQHKPQLFIINKVERFIDGKINIYADHIKSLCNQYVTKNATVYTDDDENILENATPVLAWNKIITENMNDNTQPPFSFNSDITSKANFSLGLTKSETLGNILGGTEGSFLDTWGGYFEYDNFNIKLLKNRGEKQNYELRYGRNISEATQTEEISSLYSHILPYGEVKDMAQDSTIKLVGNLVKIPNSESKFRRVFLYDCSEKTKNLKVYSARTETHDAGFGYDETKSKMESLALKYSKSNKLGNISVNIKVTHRAELDEMSKFSLGDDVKVILDNFGTATYSQISEVEYDVLNERWDVIDVGEPKATLASLFLNHKKYLNGIF